MIDVIARKGIRVPVEDNPTRYITDDAPASVANTVYYQRRLKDGDLVLHADGQSETAAINAAAPAAKAQK